MRTITYLKPNLKDEWNEVEYQPGVLSYFKTEARWLKDAAAGQEVPLSKAQVNRLENHDAEWRGLADEKKDRVEAMFKAGKVELPIVLRDEQLLYLLAGNTRLSFARKHKYPLKVWLIETPDLEEHL